MMFSCSSLASPEERPNVIYIMADEPGYLLDELSLEQNTIVFFCGDNGGNDYFRDKDHPRGFHGANVNPVTGVEFRGTKGTLNEEA